MNAAEKIAREIASTYLGATPERVGREWRTFCPVHETEGFHRPSLAIWPTSDKSYGIKCMTGCPQADIWAALKARGIKTSRSGGISGEQAMKARAQREEHRVTQIRRVKDILDGAFQIHWGSPADLYLASRGLALPAEIAGMAGSPGVYLTKTILVGNDDTLIGCIVDPRTISLTKPRVVGVSVLYLNKDGTPKLDPRGKKVRRIIGTQKGHGVPYGEPGSTLVVAEGIESMLAATILLDIPFGIATLAAPNMPMLAIPEYVRKVVIAADNDTPGLIAAEKLRFDLVRAGVTATVKKWGRASGWDAADELLRIRTNAQARGANAQVKAPRDPWPGATQNAEGGR